MKKFLTLGLTLISALNAVLFTGCSSSGNSNITTVTEEQTDKESAETVAEDETKTDAPASQETSAAEETSEPEPVQQKEESAEDETMTASKLSDGITMPGLFIPDLKVPDTDAMNFVRDMGIGFNLGNTFDAYSDPTPSDEMSTETCWHGTYTTKEMIQDIHAYGFDTIRIPVSWHNHVDSDVNISAKWLDRVNEVVDWAYEEGMYVIIDIHHDNHAAANGLYPDKAHMDRSRTYIRKIWEQLSERFKDYDEHLIFESMNEPRLVDTEHEWWLDPEAADCIEAVECINELNQLFVDTVRSSGGNNATRYLMCPGYCASVDGGTNDNFRLPEDTEGNEAKIILSIHAYTPYNFALEYPGVKDFDIKNSERTSEIDLFMDKLYKKYVLHGTPVVIGEFGCRDKGGNLQDRVNFTAYYVAMAQARNIPCVWWDNNEFKGDGELFGIYNRKDPSNSNTDVIAALMEYK